ncbi:MAG: MerR family transcriptional regulator [Chitinivibrionales bacterium]
MSSHSPLLGIGDVSSVIKLPRNTIRFWETQFPAFLSPIRTSGNQRKYGPTQIKALLILKYLRYKRAYSIRHTRKLLEKKTRPAIFQTYESLFLRQSPFFHTYLLGENKHE